MTLTFDPLTSITCQLVSLSWHGNLLDYVL